jgi:hypothetical protein
MKEDKIFPQTDLRAVCFKLRSIQHLLSNQQQGAATELDEPDIWYGLGLILGEIHGEILRHSQQLEEMEISKSLKRSNKRKSKLNDAK